MEKIPYKGIVYNLEIEEDNTYFANNILVHNCGTPVITTNYGGQTDYITNKNGWLIDYDLKPATGGVLYEESLWGIPRQPHLQKLMREAYENSKSRKRKSFNGIKTAKKYTWENTGKAIIKAFSTT